MKPKSLQHFILGMAGASLAACWSPPYDEKAVNAKLNKEKYVTHHTYAHGDRTMHYVSAGNREAGKMVVFIPGSPGTWEAFGEYLADPDLRDKTLMLSIDRPGLGNSDLGCWEGSLEKQVAAIAPAIEVHGQDREILIVGHSFGGPVAARLAVDRAELVDEMLLLSASLDPALEKTKFIQHVGNFPLIRWAVPKNLDVANQEIGALKEQLTIMQPRLKEISAPVTVIQGTKDTLVPAANAEYIRAEFTGTQAEIIYLDGQNHFIVWNEYPLIRSKILKWVRDKG